MHGQTLMTLGVILMSISDKFPTSSICRVWHTNGTKIYEIPLKSNIKIVTPTDKFKIWNVTFRFLIFTMDASEGEPGYIQIVDLDEANHISKVLNFGLDSEIKYISYNDEYLYAGSDKEIFVTKVSLTSFSTAGEIIDIKNSNQLVRKYTPGLTIHGFIQNIHCIEECYQLVVLETNDNQLDFNKFFIYNFDDDTDQSYKFEQYRHIMPRPKLLNDPIIKNCYTFSNGFNYTLSMRKSGGFDIYWNMARKDSVEYKKVKDIDMSITSYFFKMQDGTYWWFPHQDKSNINFQEAEQISENELDFDNIHVKTVQNIVKLYTGVQIVKINGDTVVIITHGKFVSIYEITLEKWLNHIEFEDDILTLFRHYKDDDSRYQSILCKNGAVYVGVLDYDDYSSAVPGYKRNCMFSGEIIRFNEDIENNHTLYVVTKLWDSYKLSCLYRGDVKEIEKLKEIDENCSIACLQYRGDDSHVVIQNGEKTYLYKQKPDVELELLREFNFTEITGHIHSGCGYDITKNFFVFDERNMYVFKMESETSSKIKVYENVFCIGIQNFNENFNYALCQETSESQYPGLRLFDMQSIVNKDKIDMLLLKKIDIGSLGYFEYGANVVRFAFVNSLTNVVVTPILHRNMNKFIGISENDDYLCYNVIKDQMIALTPKGELFTWNILTCKFEKKVLVEGLDLEDYSLVSAYKRGPVLLKSDTTVSECKDEDYFFPWELSVNIDKQEVFVKAQTFSYRKYRYIEIISPDRVKIHLEYVSPSYEKEWIFISNDCERMVTILTNYRTYLYQAVKDTKDPMIDYKIKWQLVRCINDYPADLEDDANRLEYFSPCHTRYLILDKKTREFVVKDTESGFELSRIPKDILTVDKGDPKPSNAINRIKWLQASRMLIVNEEGYEKIVDIDNNYIEISENYRPLFNDIDGVEWKNCYYYCQRDDLGTNEVLKKLQRKYQDYKTNYYLFKKRGIENNLELIFGVDPVQWDFSNQSFSFSHWSLIEQLQKGKLNIEDMENMVVKNLIYDILPGGNTILHQLCSRKDQIQKLFDISHQDSEIKIHIPILPNFKSQTCFSICVDNSDYKTIDVMLKYLSLYPIGHHSMAIKSMIPIFIEQQLPSFLNVYLDSRFQQTNQLKKIHKGTLKKEPEPIFVSEIWFRKNELKERILTPIQNIETTFKLEFLDLPGIYHYLDPAFSEVFIQLAETERFEYFDNKAIQTLIEFNYSLIQDWVTYAIVYPYITFHLVFVVYMNAIYEHRKHGEDFYTYSNWVFSLVLLILSTYFLILESIQCGKQGLKYFTSIWNYIDLAAPIGVIIFQILQFLDLYEHEIDETFNRCVMAISTFFMWLKLLYILRIFKKSGYLIRMILEVIQDMGIFLLILLLTVLAFGDAFLRLSLANSEDLQFTNQFFYAGLFAYRMILGDFDTSAFGEVAVPLVWIFFILCTIFDMIVMLNLLISIISDTYARMTENADRAAFQEMASLICENAYIIPLTIKNSYAKKDKFLVCFTDLEKVENQQVDPVQDKLRNLQKNIAEMKKVIETIQTKQNSMADEQSKMKKEINEKLDKLLLKNTSSEEKEKKVFEKLWSKIHKHQLEKMTLKELGEINSNYEGGFGCDARKLTECKSGMTSKSEYRKIANEVIYHCEECSFDFCEKCFQYYKNAHNHVLKKTTFDQLDGDYSGGWLCDAAVSFKGCSNQGNYDLFHNETTVLYHDGECDYDLCESCMQAYKFEDQ